jgi:hypothetical protein
MLEGKYTDEEALLKRIYDFIKTQETINEKKEAEQLKHRLSVYASGNYLLPSGKLADVFSYGYGGMAGLTLHNAGISLNNKTLFHLDLTLAAGYWQLAEKAIRATAYPVKSIQPLSYLYAFQQGYLLKSLKIFS